LSASRAEAPGKAEENVEIELKIEVPSLDPIRRRLEQLGAVCAGQVEEDNVYFDQDDTLLARGESLRLRRDRDIRLTWKGPTDYRKGVVQREEIEIHVDDLEATWAILQRLGFGATDRLAKRRETWNLLGAVVALDELAFGCFVEIEGGASAIQEIARQLELNPADGIAHSYRRLQADRQPGSKLTEPRLD
jgi:adenylate cyclase class 2